MALDKRSQVSLTFGTEYKTIVSLGFNYYEFGLNSYRKMNILRFFPYKCTKNQI